MDDRERAYLDLILKPIKICANYKPKFGQGQKVGISLEEFQNLYQTHPFYKWLGLDNPLMYAAHKSAGGMTSIYRQIGIGCENLLRTILRDQLRLAESDVRWTYEVQGANGKTRHLSLDARIPLAAVGSMRARKRILNWIRAAGKELGIASSVANALEGTVFEIRQGYKSKDSKRQNADIGNAATAYAKAYLPCALVLSSQMDTDIIVRYRAERWQILTGAVSLKDPLRSTYDFYNEVVGYDLASFFDRNSAVLKEEVDAVLRKLLAPSE